MATFPIQVDALRVEQPMGIYYVTVLEAEVLLQVAFSDTMTATMRDGDSMYVLQGTQRAVQPQRLQAIADFINREDAAFPNSIILAANYRPDNGLIEDEEPEEQEGAGGSPTRPSPRWAIDELGGSHCVLRIPTAQKLAAIIDGQHRLFAFTKAHTTRLKMPLICSVFLDLPKPYQAQLFATINSTQKPVNKSLTYELFGYNVDEEAETYWSPDKLAVFLTRRLAVDETSPLCGRIVVAPEKDDALARLTVDSKWKVSTAVVVEGIMRLYTNNPKKDTTNLLEEGQKKERAALGTLRTDRSPLRQLYLENQDAVLYAITVNFLRACDELFWSRAGEGSFITKTVGVQALFDVLRRMASRAQEGRNISVEYFRGKLSPASGIDFASDQFRNASGSGRSFIRRTIEETIDLQS
jgi:DNA phosphorothioation-associated DGQHR protein 1